MVSTSRRSFCVVQIAGSLALVALAARPAAGGSNLDMFTTSGTGTGDLRSWSVLTEEYEDGLEAGDAICAYYAAVAGPTRAPSTEGIPTYRAWLSTTATDAYCHVQGLAGKMATNCGGFGGPAGPWIRRDGVPFSGPLDELVTDGPLSTPSIDEAGLYAGTVGGAPPIPGLAWTGTKNDGTLANDQCTQWTSSAGGGQSIALTTSASQWSQGDALTDGCGTAKRLYCFLQGSAPPVEEFFEPGALAFVTNEAGTADLESWSGSAGQDGLVGADEVCQSEAAAARLPSPDSFRAWLSDGGVEPPVNAKDRFPSDIPWVRVDGIRVANDLADIINDGNIRTPLRKTAFGEWVATQLEVWTGTFSGGTASPSSCDSWSTTEVAETPPFGLADEVSFAWTVKSTDSCEKSFRLYCLADIVVLFWDDFETEDVARWSFDVGFEP